MDKDRCDKLLLDCMTMKFSFSSGDVRVGYRDVIDLIQDRDEAWKEVERLRARAIGHHRSQCTPENCVLDGRPEHGMAFRDAEKGGE